MKIGIYARCLSHKYGGVKEYATSMIDAIIPLLTKEDELYVIHNLKEKLYNKENIKEILISSDNRIITDFFLAPKILNQLNLDLIWFPHDTIPFRVKGKKLLTIHDLAYFDKINNYYTKLDSLYMKIMMRSSVKRANRIIAVSNNTKQDIIKYLTTSQDKIKVIYEAYNKNLFKTYPKNKQEEIKHKYSLVNPFLLFTGGISPRKNLKRLIHAFNNLTNPNLDLVLTGGDFASWNNKEEIKLINSNQRIKRLGYIPKQDLPVLYSLAEAYIYPSLYEGFGLPILEAQACSCPVIASNATSLPEVAGSSVYYINPESEDEIRKAVKTLISNKKLRQQLIKKGKENLKRFSWKTSAEELLKEINEVGEMG